MIKICSLDFINRDFFETDILTADGRILCPKGEKITPRLILKLYFKEIFINEPLKPAIKTPAAVTDNSDITEELAKISEIAKQAEETAESKEKLEFDEEEAQRVSDLSVKLGKLMKLSGKPLEELKQAAFYHNIGRKRLTKGDLNKKDFKKRQATEGYDILINEKKLPVDIAEVAKFYNKKYETSIQKQGDKISYVHIVAITSFYDRLLNQNMSKDEALDKMLQLGGNRFNIFILHKFIHMMRENND